VIRKAGRRAVQARRLALSATSSSPRRDPRVGRPYDRAVTASPMAIDVSAIDGGVILSVAGWRRSAADPDHRAGGGDRGVRDRPRRDGLLGRLPRRARL